jgi:PilZ domain
MRSELRRSPRYPFYASAEIVELKTSTLLTARTSELSRYGAYMDMMNPLPIGTAVKILIAYNEQAFEAAGRVIYSQPNMGMGVAFESIEPGKLETLEKWLNQLQAG